MRLEKKIAIVTGAGTGIGRAIALAFAREGAKLVLVGRRLARLEEVAKIVSPNAMVIDGDICDEALRERAVQAARSLGGLHVLVNNAGVLIPGTAESHTEKEWDRTFELNVKAVWRLSALALPLMRQTAQSGSIINISSVLGLVGTKNRVAYGASKGAVTMMTKAMAADLAEEQIRVNCICPGMVDTDMIATVFKKAPDPEAIRKQRTEAHPLARLGKPEDIAECAVFLASGEAAWVTGAAFSIDGGYTAV